MLVLLVSGNTKRYYHIWLCRILINGSFCHFCSIKLSWLQFSSFQNFLQSHLLDPLLLKYWRLFWLSYFKFFVIFFLSVSSSTSISASCFFRCSRNRLPFEPNSSLHFNLNSFTKVFTSLLFFSETLSWSEVRIFFKFHIVAFRAITNWYFSY